MLRSVKVDINNFYIQQESLKSTFGGKLMQQNKLR